MSKPVLGMFIGLIAGIFAGLAMIAYFEVINWFDRWCVPASTSAFLSVVRRNYRFCLGKASSPRIISQMAQVTIARSLFQSIGIAASLTSS